MVPEGSTIGDMIEFYKIPSKSAHLVMVNGVYVNPDQRLSYVLKEKDALAKYAHTLEALLQKYPPNLQEALLLKFSEKAGFIEGSSLFNQDVIERIEHHKRCIKCNYEYSSQLVVLVHKLLQR